MALYKDGFVRTLTKTAIIGSFLVLAALPVSGCDLTRNHLKMDRTGNMEFQDYRDAMAPREVEDMDLGKPEQGGDIPQLSSYVVPPSEDLKPMPLVSVSVNQTVPLRDALYELAEQAEYDVELDPRITGSVIFTAKDKPFDVVVERLADVAGLRYKFDGDVLRMELDTPYNKTYKIDYLSYIRKNTGAINNNVTVSSSGGESSGPNAGSQFQAASESEANFWGELETNLTQLLGADPAKSALKTSADPKVAAPDDQGGGASLDVSSIPPVAPAAGAASGGAVSGGASSFAMNKQAGLISVHATERQHKQVAEYLKLLHRAVTAQVLIEAKILEVNLSDEFATGIDWNVVNQAGGELVLGLDAVGNQGARPTFDIVQDNPLTDFALGYIGNDVTALINAISRFGTVKALASPRLTVLNNQSAVLNVASNEVYFELDINVTTQDQVTRTDIDSSIRNVPEGVLINVQPSIDLDDRTISMAVRPTITKIITYRNDPSVQFVAAQNNIEGVQSRVPVVNVQEMDSVVRMGSGQALVMGGLMRDRAGSTQNGIPVLSEVPVVGSLFRNQVDNIEKTELIVFLKATIIDSASDSIDNTDRDIYKIFSGDRRPLKM